MLCHLHLSFPVPTDDPRLYWLFREFRLLVNESIRIAQREGIRSRARLSQAAYSDLSRRCEALKEYILSAFGVALSATNAHRRRLNSNRASIPYMRNLMFRIGSGGYRFDWMRGLLRIAVRPREYVYLSVAVSEWHRRFLTEASWNLGSLTVVPGKAIIVLRRENPPPYVPRALLALDTNEDSLDGAIATGEGTTLVAASLGGIPRVRETHFRRRRRLARKKANDRRVSVALQRREGRRERHRVTQRLHRVSTAVVRVAEQGRAAIVLEKLTLWGAGSHSPALNRRLSSWPRREIHRQIEYKAAMRGVPVLKINPKFTSKTCPVCGARRRERVGKVFDCPCGWRLDRQLNAGLNILRTALASSEALARAVRFQPDALRRDVVIPLYDVLVVPTRAREEPSEAESSASETSLVGTCSAIRPRDPFVGA